MGEKQQNIMAYVSPAKLVLIMGLPMMMSMFMQAMYNIVDSIFVARVSEDALTAVSLCFPIQSVIIAVVSGTGVGVNARLSRKLGEKKPGEAWLTAGNGILIALVYSAIFFALGFFVPEIFFRSLTDDTSIIGYGIDYSSIILTLAVACTVQMTGERLLQATGKTVYSMIIQGTGAIINIVMDPILIFGLLGFPALGVKGAAIATVFGQFVAAGLGIFFNLRANRELSFGVRYLVPAKEVIGDIYRVGIPSIFMQGIGSVMNFGINKILIGFTATAATAFGVYFKLQSFIFMPLFGMNNAVVPIVAFNFGAKNPRRIKDTIRISTLYATFIMLIGMLVFEVFPGFLLSLFNASDSLYEIGVPALRIIAVSFILAGYDVIVSSVFQALGDSMKSLWISFTRQIVVLLPLAFILSGIFGLSGVWWSFPLAEIVSFAMCTVFLRQATRRRIDPLYAA